MQKYYPLFSLIQSIPDSQLTIISITFNEVNHGKKSAIE
jgi:hypothetical protein